jgi:hypothetical protein
VKILLAIFIGWNILSFCTFIYDAHDWQRKYVHLFFVICRIYWRVVGYTILIIGFCFTCWGLASIFLQG